MSICSNKRGIDSLTATIIIIILNIIFFAAMFAFVERNSTNVGQYEQIYSKKLALMIDSAEPGTIVYVSLEEVKPFLEENKRSVEEAFVINGNKINVKLGTGAGYAYDFFNNYDVKISSHRDVNGQLFLDMLIGERK
ncbi:MAG: hypothetical protein WC781_02915 [Candidatus Pacearchaeota archaeon]|jgi:hypothetical protein